jgi:hypothetical protein
MRLAHIFHLLAEDSRRNVYAGELEVRPRGAPTIERDSLSRRRVLGRDCSCQGHQRVVVPIITGLRGGAREHPQANAIAIDAQQIREAA